MYVDKKGRNGSPINFCFFPLLLIQVGWATWNQRHFDTERERQTLAAMAGRRAPFCSFPFFYFFSSTNGFRWKDAQRRRRSMDTRKAILPHRARNHSRSVSFHIQYPPSLWSLPTHITMVPYRAQLLGSRHRIFLQLKKFLLGIIFEWKCKTYITKKQHTYRGALEIALDTSSTFSSIVWKLTNTKSSSQTTVVLRIEKTKYENKS